MEAPALARRLTVILHADMERYSCLLEREEEGTRWVLRLARGGLRRPLPR